MIEMNPIIVLKTKMRCRSPTNKRTIEREARWSVNVIVREWICSFSCWFRWNDYLEVESNERLEMNDLNTIRIPNESRKTVAIFVDLSQLNFDQHWNMKANSIIASSIFPAPDFLESFSIKCRQLLCTYRNKIVPFSASEKNDVDN